MNKTMEILSKTVSLISSEVKNFLLFWSSLIAAARILRDLPVGFDFVVYGADECGICLEDREGTQHQMDFHTEEERQAYLNGFRMASELNGIPMTFEGNTRLH